MKMLSQNLLHISSPLPPSSDPSAEVTEDEEEQNASSSYSSSFNYVNLLCLERVTGLVKVKLKLTFQCLF